MSLLKTEILGLIYQLMPGFLAAWCFYGLTAHQKSSEFERTVQALIFTTIVRAVVVCVRFMLLWLGTTILSVGQWTDDGEFVVSVVIGVLIGVAFASSANNNWPHGRLPDWITKRTSYPSEWYSFFTQTKRYVCLHLKGEKESRRILGWPFEWPDSPSGGHFVLMEAEWFLPDNTRVPVWPTEKFLIPASEVEMVELLAESYQPSRFEGMQPADVIKPLLELQKQDLPSLQPQSPDASQDEVTSLNVSPAESPPALITPVADLHL